MRRTPDDRYSPHFLLVSEMRFELTQAYAHHPSKWRVYQFHHPDNLVPKTGLEPARF